MAREDWMSGCATSLSGLHIYEKSKDAARDETARYRSCNLDAPLDDRVAILTFIENAEARLKEDRKQREIANIRHNNAS